MKQSVRFSIFKRDRFICQYCGKTPPSVVLEIDHIHPKSKGGSSEEDNLLTSCFDCNRGKAAGLLSQAPPTVAEKAAILAEREEQLKAYNRLLAAKRRREIKEVNKVETVFKEAYPDMYFTPSFVDSIRKNFLSFISVDDLCEYMRKSCVKMDSAERVTKYFCGICWHVIKGKR